MTQCKRLERDPTVPGPPLCVTDHPPAHYAQFHANDTCPIRTTPHTSPNQHPRGVYIFQKDIVRMQTTVYTHQMINDYAYPTMMAEKALKELHDAALRREYEKAIEWALKAAVHCWEANAALWAMSEEEKKRDRAVAVGS